MMNVGNLIRVHRVLLVVLILPWFVQVFGSSHFRSRSQGSRRYHPYSFAEDDSSSHHSPSPLEDEELILSALARTEEIPDRLYRPRSRGVTAVNDTPRDLDILSQPKSRRRKLKRGKRKKKKQSTSKKQKLKSANSPDALGVASSATEKASTRVQEAQNIKISSSRDSVQDSAPRVLNEGQIQGTSSPSNPATTGTPMTTIPKAYNYSPSLDLPRQRLPPMTMPPSTKSPSMNSSAHTKEASVSTTTPWVRRYLNARPKDVLLPVPKEYIADGFNLAQLAPIVERIGFQVMGPQAVEVAKRLVELPPPQPSYPIYRLALQLLLNEDESQEANILQHPLIPPQVIQQASEALYLMVHARFVLSPRGLDALRRILLNSPVFGKCPRIHCDGTMLLPYGASNDFSSNTHTCQRYCPSCGNLWNCWDSKTDGCAWGPSLCYLLLMAHGHEMFPRVSQRHASQLLSTDILHHPSNPAIFGFRIHPAAAWGRPVTG